MKLIITGHGDHGKDTVTSILSKHLSCQGSSQVACELVVFPTMQKRYGYKNHAECFADRRNHRSEWFEIIKDFNSVDPTRLGRLILERDSIYNGIRNNVEFYALKRGKHFDFSVWVDGSERKPPEPDTSMNIVKEDCDYILNNNGTEAELPQQIIDMLCWILNKKQEYNHEQK